MDDIVNDIIGDNKRKRKAIKRLKEISDDVLENMGFG